VAYFLATVYGGAFSDSIQGNRRYRGDSSKMRPTVTNNTNKLNCTCWLYTGWQKSKSLPIIKKSYWIVLKPADEIRFHRQIKVSIKYDNIRWY